MKLKLITGLTLAITSAAVAQTTPASQPSICSRSCWSARSESCSTSLGSLTRAIVHHTAGPGDYTTSYETGKSRMRSNQNYHMDNNGWCGIGYHFLVNAAGHIYEGRRDSLGSSSSWKRGAHDSCNANSMGFTALGYFHTPYNHAFTSAMQNSLAAVIAWRMPSGWTPSGSTTYCGNSVGRLDGHYKVTSTSCPGSIIINKLGALRTDVSNRRTPVVHDRHVVGDWDGNGTVTPGVVRKEGGNLTWYLKNSNSGGTADITLTYGVDTDIPIVGDWDGNGTATVGVVRGATWLLRNSNSGGEAQISFNYGQTGDKFLAGDWDGNGTWTPGVVQGITWHLKNSLSGGSSDIEFGYGQTGDQFVVGDWDGNGTFTAGIYRSNDWYLKNSHSSGAADLTYGFGQAGDEAIPGNWDGSASNKTWTPGVIQDGNSWNLRNSNSTGVADITFVYGQ